MLKLYRKLHVQSFSKLKPRGNLRKLYNGFRDAETVQETSSSKFPQTETRQKLAETL